MFLNSTSNKSQNTLFVVITSLGSQFDNIYVLRLYSKQNTQLSIGLVFMARFQIHSS
jgi:hypothetical protein